MFIKKLRGGGEIRARQFGCTWSLSVVNENAKGVTVSLDLAEGGDLGRLLMFEDKQGFSEEDTGVIDVSNIDGEQHAKESTDD